MEDVLIGSSMNDRITEIFRREQGRLRSFVRRRVADEGDAEDILQDVFYALVEANWLTRPVEQVGAWLFRVARNRIVDFFRKKRPEALADVYAITREGQEGSVEDLLPSLDAGPEAAYARSVLMEELEAALGELPPEQRDIFIANEIEGRSFRE